VQRYLQDEPVAAGPPSAAYRLRKFLRRHRGPVLGAALLLLALVGGIVGTTLGLLSARASAAAERTARIAAADKRPFGNPQTDFSSPDTTVRRTGTCPGTDCDAT
jgi:hypothetical protein